MTEWVQPSRETLRSRRKYMGARAKTEHPRNVSKRKLEEGRVHLALLVGEGIDLDAERPKTRGDCLGGARPCPWVGCRYNLFLDRGTAGGVKFNFPDLEPEEVDPARSCALDVADQGGGTLEDVALTMNLTRERVRQIEMPAIEALKTAPGFLSEFAPDGDLTVPRARVNNTSVFVRERPTAEGSEEEPPTAGEAEEPVSISFFTEPESPRLDALVTARVWMMLSKSHVAGEIAGSLPAARLAVEGLNMREPPLPWQARVTRAGGVVSLVEESNLKEPALARAGEKTMARAASSKPLVVSSPMVEEGLTERLRKILEVVRAAEAKGEVLRSIEIADRVGIRGGSANSRGANVSGALVRLRKKGLLLSPSKGLGRPRGPKESKERVEEPKKRSTRAERSAAIAFRREQAERAQEPAAVPSPSPGPVVSSSVVSARDNLVALREKLLADVEKLTKAIEALGELTS